jgi:hypothetical protein
MVLTLFWLVVQFFPRILDSSDPISVGIICFVLGLFVTGCAGHLLARAKGYDHTSWVWYFSGFGPFGLLCAMAFPRLDE